MRFQPTYEARRPDRVVQIGPGVLSLHVLGRYPGWGSFRQELADGIDELFNSLTGVRVLRIGLRYINALNKVDHFVAGFDDLTLETTLCGQPLQGPRNLNFIMENPPDMVCTTRVASREFVSGTAAGNVDVLIDVDVYTGSEHSDGSAEGVKRWVEQAHDFEKERFFALLRKETIAKLEA